LAFVDFDTFRETDLLLQKSKQEKTEMKTYKTLLMAIALTVAGPIALAGQNQAMPGSGTPAVGGKGPGMGHDYRRNIGGPGLGRGAMPAEQRPAPSPQATPPARPERPTRPQPPEPPQAPGLGYRGYPGWNPGMGTPYAGPGPRYGRPGRQGYGYPGYRGRGGEGYPGHRQYGNPPRMPSAPPANE